jgi:serine/threonine-protein kinase
MSRFDDLLRTGGALAGRIGDAALSDIAGARAPQAGDELGPFRIVREVGRGGMAVVFLAERADGQFSQKVALKWILALAASPATREMFLRERQILADLAHPHIARLIDGGETADGQLWFAMQWIDGEAIDQWCTSHRSDLRQRVRLVLQVASALRFAHARLLVHCDVKASNILVDAEGVAHLLDFGVARLSGPRDGAVATGYTPAVASPEQRAGLAVDTGSDVYQLGLLLGTLLGARVVETAADGHHARRLGGQDRRFDWPADVPEELRAIVLRATRADPAARYEGMAALAEDCSAWLARRPVAAYRSGFGYALRCFLRRNPALSVVSATSLAVLVGLSGAFTWRLAAERDQARAAAARAEAVSSFLVRLFRDVDPAANRIAADAARSLVQRGEAALSDGLAGTPDVRAAVLATLAEVNQSLGDFAAAERLARESLAAEPAAAPAVLARRRAQLAQALASRGDYDAAIETTRVAIAAIAAIAERDDVAVARARLLAAQANAAQLKGDLELAVASARALLADSRAPEAALEMRAMAHLTLAYVAEQRGDFAGALAEADAAGPPLSLALGEDHPRVSALQAYRAYLLLGVGRHAEAERAADAAVAGLSQVYGSAHARLSYALTNQALAQLRVGKPELARATGERALAMCRELLSPDHAQCAVSAQVLATIAEAGGDDAAALPLLRDVLRVRRATLRPDHAYVGFAEVQLADALCRAGDAAGAREHAAEAERILSGVAPTDPERQRLAAVRARCG